MNRIQLSRKKGWKMPPNTVRVSRPGRYGNLFKIGDWIRPKNGGLPFLVETAEMAVALFQVHAMDKEAGLVFRRNVVTELRGKNLACWCPLDQPCHADVLLEIANSEVGITTSEQIQ